VLLHLHLMCMLLLLLLMLLLLVMVVHHHRVTIHMWKRNRDQHRLLLHDLL
jgi:hypothetical protein